MRGYATTVGATATLLVAADDKWRAIYLHVVGNQPVALGNASVTFATGLLTEKHTSPVEIQMPLGETLYAVCDAGQTEIVRVLIPDSDS